MSIDLVLLDHLSILDLVRLVLQYGRYHSELPDHLLERDPSAYRIFQDARLFDQEIRVTDRTQVYPWKSKTDRSPENNAFNQIVECFYLNPRHETLIVKMKDNANQYAYVRTVFPIQDPDELASNVWPDFKYVWIYFADTVEELLDYGSIQPDDFWNYQGQIGSTGQ